MPVGRKADKALRGKALRQKIPRRERGSALSPLPLRDTRKLTKRDMLHNNACPDIHVDSQTFEVFVDGALADSQPVETVALSRRYMLR